jgi:hypothetical protein
MAASKFDSNDVERARGLDRFLDATDAMGREVNHNDKVAWHEFGNEHLRIVGMERVAIRRSADDRRRSEAVDASARCEGRSLPIAAAPSSAPSPSAPVPFQSGFRSRSSCSVPKLSGTCLKAKSETVAAISRRSFINPRSRL